MMRRACSFRFCGNGANVDERECVMKLLSHNREKTQGKILHRIIPYVDVFFE